MWRSAWPPRVSPPWPRPGRPRRTRCCSRRERRGSWQECRESRLDGGLAVAGPQPRTPSEELGGTQGAVLRLHDAPLSVFLLLERALDQVGAQHALLRQRLEL